MTRTWIDAGRVGAGTAEYIVLLAGDHDTLRRYDIVVVVEAPFHGNMLLRKSDMTLHANADKRWQYVILDPVVNTKPPPASAPVCESTPKRTNNDIAVLTIGGFCVGKALRLDGGSWAYDTRCGALAAAGLRAIADELDRMNGGEA